MVEQDNTLEAVLCHLVVEVVLRQLDQLEHNKALALEVQQEGLEEMVQQQVFLDHLQLTLVVEVVQVLKMQVVVDQEELEVVVLEVVVLRQHLLLEQQTQVEAVEVVLILEVVLMVDLLADQV